MKSFAKLIGALFILLVAIAIIFPVFANLQERKRIHESQYRFFANHFDGIEHRGNQVIFTPNKKWGFPDKNRRRSFAPMVLAPGSTFEYHGRHWGWTYKIEKIEQDGVIIRYSSSHPAIKLGWKSLVRRE